MAIEFPGYEGFKLVKVRQVFLPGPRGWVNTSKRAGESVDKQIVRLLAKGVTAFNLTLKKSLAGGAFDVRTPDFQANEVRVVRPCSSCLKGDADATPHPAEFWCEGQTPRWSGDGMRPLRAFLCGEHADAVECFEGGTLTVQLPVPAE